MGPNQLYALLSGQMQHGQRPGGMFGMTPPPQPESDPVFNEQSHLPPPRPQGGMFGGGKVQIDLGRALAGYLAGSGNPAGAQTLQAMNQLRQSQIEHHRMIDDYNRKRTDDNADWQTREQWKLDNPGPGDSEYERALAAQGILPGTPEYAKHMAIIGQLKENPMVMTPYGPMPYSQVQGAQAPTKPVGKLTPINEGGPSQGGSGGFPGYR